MAPNPSESALMASIQTELFHWKIFSTAEPSTKVSIAAIETRFPNASAPENLERHGCPGMSREVGRGFKEEGSKASSFSSMMVMLFRSRSGGEKSRGT